MKLIERLPRTRGELYPTPTLNRCRGEVQLADVEAIGLRLSLPGVVCEHVQTGIHPGIDAELDALLRDASEVEIGEPCRKAPTRHERDDRGRQRPARRRVRGGVPRTLHLREEDVVLRPVHVEGGRNGRRSAHDATVSDFEGIERLLLEIRIPHRLDGQRIDAAGQRRAEGPQVDRLGYRHVEKVVDDRRRPVGAVVREPDRLTLSRLDHEGRARREHEVVQVVEAVDARADHPPEVIGQEDLVLREDAELGAIRPLAAPARARTC